MPQVLGREVGPIGLGLMGLTWRPQPPPLEDAIATMKAALEEGVNFWNAGEFYGTPEYNSMTIIKAYFEKYPEDAEKVVLIVKGGTNLKLHKTDGSPENIRRSIDNIIQQLGGTKKLDVFGIARRDAQTPLGLTLNTIKQEYIDTGKIGGVSLSECRAETIHEASKFVTISAVEVELSMFSPDILKNGVAAACAEYGIPIAAYSPMSRGLLTGAFRSTADYKNTIIESWPRFQQEAMDHNLKLVDQVSALAEKKGCTPGQFAIAWVRGMSNRPGLPTIIPIPGSSAPSRAKENSKVVELSEEDIKTINEIIDGFKPSGGRYPNGAPIET
ncbi:pyridoxine 4-dehydrogenase [Paramyrothecium foliicola]|nr:pyridoxine 4-dehydrogenase [Paramyrothecium foliicola]